MIDVADDETRRRNFSDSAISARPRQPGPQQWGTLPPAVACRSPPPAAATSRLQLTHALTGAEDAGAVGAGAWGGEAQGL